MTEEDYLREGTTAFIAADPKEITLSRRTATENGAGGYTEAYNPLPSAQTLRLIPQHGSLSPLRETLDGEAVQPDYVLLGEWNADIQRWDTFVDNGRRYIVLFVHEKKAYEVKGEVKYLGEA